MNATRIKKWAGISAAIAGAVVLAVASFLGDFERVAAYAVQLLFVVAILWGLQLFLGSDPPPNRS